MASSSEEYESGSDDDYSTAGSESSSLETDSDDSYEYPWQDTELDRFSSFDDLSSDALMSKILDSLPVYDPPNSDSDNEFEYPDPDLYAVREAELTQEILINEDTSPGTSYLPNEDELYLNWVDEFELVLYPSDFGDIDEPLEDEKDVDEAPAETATDATEQKQEGKRKANAAASTSPTSPISPVTATAPRSDSIRHKTPDPAQSQEAMKRSQSSKVKRDSRSASPNGKQPPRGLTATKLKVRDRIKKQVNRRMQVGAKRQFRVGKKVKVYGETAVIRYIGEIDDPAMPGEVYGVEFSHRSERGENDGSSVMGTQYFECEPGQGAFVQKGLIKPVRKHTRKRARFVGNVFAFERDNLLRERRDNRTRRGRVARKLGPREIGRSEYRPREYELKEDTTSFLAPRPATKSRSSADVKVRKKAGPRDVGRSKYRPQEFTEVPRSESMSGRTPSPRGPRGVAPKKLGPREMRKKRANSNWRPPNYEIKESGSFLEDRVVRSKSNAQQRQRAPKKKGPRDYKKSPREGGSDSPRHIHNEHAARRKRKKSRDRRRRGRRSSSTQQSSSAVTSPRPEVEETTD